MIKMLCKSCNKSELKAYEILEKTIFHQADTFPIFKTLFDLYLQRIIITLLRVVFQIFGPRDAIVFIYLFHPLYSQDRVV